jgi:hypothetical protein
LAQPVKAPISSTWLGRHDGNDGTPGVATVATERPRGEEIKAAIRLTPSPLMSHTKAAAAASNAMVWMATFRVSSGSGFSSMDMDP